MIVEITLEPYPEAADEGDSTGLSLEAFEAIIDFLSGYGDDVTIRKAGG